MKYKIMLILVVLFTLNACNNKNREVESTIGNWVGKQFIMPQDSLLVNSTSNIKPLKKKLKIITFLDSGCSCIKDLSNWKEIMKVIDTSKTGFIYIIRSDGELSDFKYIDSTEIHLNYPYFFDKKDIIRLKNKVSDDKLYQTFLLNRDNKVILVGDPTLHEKIKDLYIKEIKKRI